MFRKPNPAISNGARLLLMALREKQTDPNGRVAYGKTLTYGRISMWFDGQVPGRSLRRWMAELKAVGAITMRIAPMRAGMQLQISASHDRRFPGRQYSLFGAPTVEKAVQNRVNLCAKRHLSSSTGAAKNGVLVRPSVAAEKHYNYKSIIQNPRDKDSRASSPPPKLPNKAKPITPPHAVAEHRRRIEKRNERIARELLDRHRAHEGSGPLAPPFRPPVSFRTIAHADLRGEIIRLANKMSLGP